MTVNFIGRVGADPERRETKSGKSLWYFPVAINEYSDGQQYTQWVHVVCFDQRYMNIIGRIRKGSLAEVCGNLTARAYNDPKTGEAKCIMDMVANSVQFPSFGSRMEPRQNRQNTGVGYSQQPSYQSRPVQQPPINPVQPAVTPNNPLQDQKQTSSEYNPFGGGSIDGEDLPF